MKNTQSGSLNSWLTASAKACVAFGLIMVLSGCYFITAQRDIARDGSHPWWCVGTNTIALSDAECISLSINLDRAVAFAEQYPTLADYTAAGASQHTLFIGAPGAPFSTTGFLPASQLNPAQPNVLFYSGTSPSSRLHAVGWASSEGPQDIFPGDADKWFTSGFIGPSQYYSAAWIIRGHENHPDVFAISHPCVAPFISTLTSTSDACYIASHTQPLEIMVTNDDGIGSHGIDAIVEGLKTVSGITVNIVAPATQQSGQGGNTSPPPLTASAGITLSGEPGTAVNGTPADAVIYGTSSAGLGLTPDLVMSGINDGQNLASVGDGLSGTIGAARRALRRGVPAIALSQGGVTVSPDFPAGVAASLVLLENWRLGLAGSPHMALPNLNIPSCMLPDTVTGTVETIVGVNQDSGPLNGGGYFSAQNCASAKTVFVDDLDAFLNGWTSLADMGRVQPPNYP